MTARKGHAICICTPKVHFFKITDDPHNQTSNHGTQLPAFEHEALPVAQPGQEEDARDEQQRQAGPAHGTGGQPGCARACAEARQGEGLQDAQGVGGAQVALLSCWHFQS